MPSILHSDDCGEISLVNDSPDVRFLGLAREVVDAYQDGFFDLDPHEHEEIQAMADGVEKQATMAQRLMTRYLDV